jgi:hypothetical protein
MRADVCRRNYSINQRMLRVPAAHCRFDENYGLVSTQSLKNKDTRGWHHGHDPPLVRAPRHTAPV